MILIPVLNEEKAIGYVLDEILDLGIPRENIVVIDGGSTDKTIEIARSRGVRVVSQEGVGKAAAIRAGLRFVSTPYVLVMDGDYTYPAAYIIDLYKKIINDECDLVIGSRVFGRESQKILFKIGNKILTTFFNILYGVRIRDVLSGMYIARAEELKRVNFEMRGFGVESEIVSHFANLGKVCETPITYRSRIDPSAKKLRIVHGLQIAIDMLRLTWRYNPAFLIFILGALLLIPGIALGAWVAYMYFFEGVKHYVRGLIAIILSAVGFSNLIAALIVLYLKRVEMRIKRYLDDLLREIRASKAS